MNSHVLKLVKLVNDRLTKVIKETEVQPIAEIEVSPFHSLSPIKNAEADHYTLALKWALDNRKDESIYNIALTGPYGSGKSSILQTFKATNINPEYKFLEISLATFKEEIEDEDQVEEETEHLEQSGDDSPVKKADKTKKVKKNEDILRLIELSILQQIFYHEEDDKIPDSRFKKIKSFKQKTLRWITAGTMLALIFGTYLFFPKKIEEIIEAKFPSLLAQILHWVSLMVFIAAMAIVIYKSIRLIYGLKISKLKFQEAEIEIDKNISKSILNNHLDEILYFFEVTNYSVVYIEDLDRFRQSEIFTKLRELNLLINKSKKIDQDVVFIYAVRDEMFKDKDRTKFFDFIIPVIPIINSSNSNDKLIKLVEENKYKISSELIDDVSLFIDDMRLLYNITNEYHIYSAILDDALNQDLLLAMIIYKNIYPDDFVLLNNGEGKLFDLLQKRSSYIKIAIKQLDSEILANKQEIKSLQSIKLKDGDELRTLYINRFVNDTRVFRYFNFNGTEVNIHDAAKETNFAYFMAGNFNYYYLHEQHGNFYPNNANASFDFLNFANKIDPDESYLERLENINSKSNEAEEILKRENVRLERKKFAIRHSKIKDLLREPNPPVVMDKNGKQNQLLNILLTSGYINEDYLDYISLFYEGSISKGDRAFLLNVKSQTSSEYDVKLTRVENLIRKIRPTDFQFNYTLNYDFIDYFLVNDEYQSQKDELLNQLTNGDAKGMAFIDGFINNGTNVELLIKYLANKWAGFWKYVVEESLFPKEKIDEYYALLIRFADTEDLKQQANDSDLIKRITNDNNFLTLSPDTELLQNVIGMFNITFTYVPLERSNPVMADFVYKGKFYSLNIEMVAEVIKYAGTFVQADFDQQNYQAIKNAGVPELLTYVDEMINSYMEQVYFKLPNNKSESVRGFILLLDHDNINSATLVKLIATIETKIPDLSEVDSTITDDLLFDYNRVDATWLNVANYYYRIEEKFEKGGIKFLNNEENVSSLNEEHLDFKELMGDGESAKKFASAIIHQEKIGNENFRLLSDKFLTDFTVAELENISGDRMKVVIEEDLLDNDSANFIKLKEVFSPLHLSYLNKAANDVVDYVEDYKLDCDDIKYIMSSNAYTKEQKNVILNKIDPEIILAKPPTLLQIAKFIHANFPFNVPKSILIGALQQSLPIHDRVQLFNMHYMIFNAADILAIFQTFPNDYSDIGRLKYSPVIPKEGENELLAKNLYGRGFIANYKEDKRGIRIINFKKSK
jgi:hypothetical protein